MTKPAFRTFFSLLGVLLLASTVQAQSDSSGTCVGEPTTGPPIQLAWGEVPDPASSSRGTILTLNVTNTAEVEGDVWVTILRDFGGKKLKSKKERVRGLRAGASAAVEVDLLRPAPPTDMPYAGQVTALAEFRIPDECRRGACRALKENPDNTDVDVDEGGTMDPSSGVSTTQVSPFPVSSPAIFFHPTEDGSSFEIYGEQVLTETHSGGNLGGERIAFEDPEVVFERVTSAGKGLKANKASDAEQAIPVAIDDFTSNPPDDDAVGKDEYRLCVRWEVQINEAGRTVNLTNGTKITEDYWHGYHKPAGNGFKTNGVPKNTGTMIVTGRGPRVAVFKDGWTHNAIAHPTTGCFTFTSPTEPPFQMAVYGEHHDKRGNKAVVRNKNGLVSAWIVEVNPKKGKTRLVLVGDYSAQASLAAMSGFAIYRTTMGVTNATIDLRPTDTCGAPGGNNSSAHFDFSGLEDDIAYLRFSDGTGETSEGEPCTTNDHRRAKFIVTHELGHAMMLLRTKMNEPAVSLGLVAPDEGVCSDGDIYTPDSLEYAAVGAREGIAHFYGAAVWNNTASNNAVFSMFNSPRDVEVYTPEAGGQLWNNCNTNTKCGRTVIMDWLRFWWDVHTPFKAGKPTLEKIAAIYERAILTGNLTNSNYYQRIHEAMEVEIADEAMREQFEAFAAWNGVNTSPAGDHCIVPFSYPDCVTGNPETGAGKVGCPCTETLPVNNSTAHQVDQDGKFPDGEGSYSEDGSAQYCLDNPGDERVVCGLADQGPEAQRVPVCEVCGVDTMLGCGCDMDEDCEGFDDEDLDCHGAPLNGWSGSEQGTCLPSASSPAGRERLTEMPWFCLDNCGSKGSNYRCLYDQLEPSVVNGHGQCVDAVSCDPPVGYCEEGGDFCDSGASCGGNFDDCCLAECSSNDDCDLFGFPDHYECSAASCVPPECNGSFSAYCQLYR